MYINRNKKPGLVKRMDWISFAVLLIFCLCLLVFMKVIKVKETYTELHRRVTKIEKFIQYK